ncbi:MAG: potassium channel family protein [Gemmatimonadota bacterium]
MVVVGIAVEAGAGDRRVEGGGVWLVVVAGSWSEASGGGGSGPCDGSGCETLASGAHMSAGDEGTREELRTPERREAVREAIDRYADVPLAIAAIVLVLLTVVELSGDLRPPWDRRVAWMVWGLWALFVLEFAVKFALAPVKRRYLRKHWLDALVVVVPVLRVLRVLRILRFARAAPLMRLLIFGGRGSGGAIELLRRRHLGQLAIVTALVILLGAGAGYLLESGAPGTQIETFGDALWWAASLVTTVASGLNPITTGGRVLGFALMLYAMAVFTYFTAALASVLVGADALRPPAPAGGTPGDVDAAAVDRGGDGGEEREGGDDGHDGDVGGDGAGAVGGGSAGPGA